MNLVTLETVSKRYGERELLVDANLLINEGDCIGLLGRNGSGKTTLLKLISSLETPDSGRLTIWGNVRVRYLPQDPDLDEQLTVLETVFQSDAPQMKLLRNYERVNSQLQRQPADGQLQQQMMALNEEMDRLDGWAAEASAKTVLTQLG
ncbi:MAG: ABC-F family ATP-binding cassette domain-containing protein, partial [Anaerolineales bacterium]|nr:ABC-F family ATP-binding cassette domain-containing protein [Anaerolineales bacterium]